MTARKPTWSDVMSAESVRRYLGEGGSPEARMKNPRIGSCLFCFVNLTTFGFGVKAFQYPLVHASLHSVLAGGADVADAVEAVNVLIAAGAPVNDGVYDAVSYAILIGARGYNGYLELIQKLLHAGALPSPLTTSLSPIQTMLSLKEQTLPFEARVAILRALLVGGADINGYRRSPLGSELYTPLHHAVWCYKFLGHEFTIRQIELLLEYGADPRLVSKPNRVTLLKMAEMAGAKTPFKDYIRKAMNVPVKRDLVHDDPKLTARRKLLEDEKELYLRWFGRRKQLSAFYRMNQPESGPNFDEFVNDLLAMYSFADIVALVRKRYPDHPLPTSWVSDVAESIECGMEPRRVSELLTELSSLAEIEQKQKGEVKSTGQVEGKESLAEGAVKEAARGAGQEAVKQLANYFL